MEGEHPDNCQCKECEERIRFLYRKDWRWGVQARLRQVFTIASRGIYRPVDYSQGKSGTPRWCYTATALTSRDAG